MSGLNPGQIQTYADTGVLHPIRVMSAKAARTLRDAIEVLEQTHGDGAGGHDLRQFFRVNGQLVIPLLANIARTPAILDVVEGLLGPDLLVWSVELFIKEPGDGTHVTWHQDITYWGMGETNEEVTAWLALSDVTVEAGCMRFIPGSHKNGIVDHTDTFADDNLLSRGQHITNVDETAAVPGPLQPGEISLHHGRTFHASAPNRSHDRRVGVAIRYVTPGVRQAPDTGRDYAMLVRGQDAQKGWINVAAPIRLFEPGALRLYDAVLAAQSATLAAGAERDVSLYAKQS